MEKQIPRDSAAKLFQVEVFMDLPNISNSLKTIHRRKTDYGWLVGRAVQEFAGRLGLPVRKGSAGQWPACPGVSETPCISCRRIWSFTSEPVNFHPDDHQRVRGIRGFQNSLQFRHGFHLEKLPMDFRGHHIRTSDRRNSPLEEERNWEPREKCVDAALVNRLVRRCLASDRPAGVLVMAGDLDYAYVLREIAQDRPGIRVAVAGFRSSLSSKYLSRRFWHNTGSFAILLDECLGESDWTGTAWGPEAA